MGNDCKGIHLEAVVVVEAKGFMLDDAIVEFEATCCKAVTATGVATVEDRHVVFLCHLVEGCEERCEVLLCIDILLTVCLEKDVLALFEAKACVNVACLNLCKVLVEYLCHWGTCNVCALTRESALCKVASSVLRVCKVHI